MGSKPTKNFGKSSRGRTQGLSKIFREAIHRAHRAVIFAVAQLSSLQRSWLFYESALIDHKNAFRNITKTHETKCIKTHGKRAVLRKRNASIKKCHKNAKIKFTKAQEKEYGNAWYNCMKAHNTF